ncbi:MAG: carbohydrate ABC transporter permease [Atribacterota bacterium]
MRKNLFWIPLLLFTLLTLLPILWCISASFKHPIELYQTPPTIIPRTFTVEAYYRAVTFPGFPRYLANSVILAITSTAIALFVSVIAGYGFARYTFWMRSVLLIMILVPRILPRAALIVPLYEIFAPLGLIDTYTVLILTYTATAIPLGTWILIGFFQSVPKELEESAILDGANLLQILWKIVAPVSLPGILTVIVVSFVQSWNEFPFVLALTSSPQMRTLPYQLYFLRDTLGLPDWPLLNAFTIITIIPILVLYIRFEKNIVSGILSGALKG